MYLEILNILNLKDIIFILIGLFIGQLIAIKYYKYKNRLQIIKMDLEENDYITTLKYRIYNNNFSFICNINQGNCTCKWHDEESDDLLTGYAQSLLNGIDKDIQEYFKEFHSEKKLKKSFVKSINVY